MFLERRSDFCKVVSYPQTDSVKVIRLSLEKKRFRVICHPSICFSSASARWTRGSRPCIIDGQTGASYTYAEVESLTRRAAAGLWRMGVGTGDVVMNLLRNCPEFTFSFLGAARLGAATTTANPFYTPHEIHRQADAADAKLIITEACAVDKVLEYAAEKGLPVVTVEGKRDGCVEFSELIAGEELPEVDE